MLVYILSVCVDISLRGVRVVCVCHTCAWCVCACGVCVRVVWCGVWGVWGVWDMSICTFMASGDHRFLG